ncbi:hypothetical protein ABIA31_003107 [Catenulispora sp. MAP5-51]|uniref:hypothetical protein n=1 Tax=Catenulispora sp. MAP5-51 TaxID=3156298 RepID=UPI003516D5C3
MSEYEIGREAEEFQEPVSAGEPTRDAAEASEAVDISEAAGGADEPADEPIDEPVEEYAEPYADPQEWISGLVAKLERAEQGIGSGPRDALMARIKLAQAYSELGDSVQAAPLAVANVAQARRLFPSSEGMLRQLREFRDAACEAAGWTAAMMRESDEDLDAEEPSELVARPDAAQDSARERVPAQAEAAADLAAEPELPEIPQTPETPELQEIPEMPAHRSHLAEPEPVGAVIHEFVRRVPEPDALQWAAEVQAALTQPAELAIPAPPEPEYAEEVEPALASADLADLSDLADLAAIEEIIKLRYELREAQRTIERLRHVNRKLREALEYDEAP